METTADRIRSVVKNILPERPHHLSLYSDRKYRVSPTFWQHQIPLQYSTFLSDADRGVLLTRPFFDICDEPEPSPATSQPTPRPIPKKLNKMSFKDYQKAKKASTSPTENGIPGKLEDKKYIGTSIKLEKDTLRKEQDRIKETASHRDSKVHEPRMNGEPDRHKSSLPPKPVSKDAPLYSESKKRPVDSEDSPRPVKKHRPADSNASDVLRKIARPETPHAREHNSTNDKNRDGRAPHSTPGDRKKERDRMESPKTAVNGTKPHSLPRKPDTSAKHFVPPLLSPLHPAIDDELETIGPKKKASEKDLAGKPSSKSSKFEATTKKQRPQGLPPLLSPTLPAIIEEELARVERSYSLGEISQAPSQSSEKPVKKRTKENAEDEGKRKRIVTFKIRKHLRQRIRSLLALPSKTKKERSLSVEDTPPPPPPPPPPKKRPRQSEIIVEAPTSTATKRPKQADAYGSKAPYTPPNPPASVSHAVSGSSQLQTPGGRVSQTPGAGDGRPPSRGAPGKEVLNGRFTTMCRLGKKLKHDRDKEKQKQSNGATTNGGHLERSVGDELRPALLTMEMLLAYMIAFRSQNQAEELSGGRVDEKNWATLEAHFGELRRMTHRSPPLHTLAVQLHGIMVNELLRVYSIQGTVNDPKPEDNNARKVMRVLKNSFGIWSEADKYRSKLTDERMKTPAMGPWTSAYKAATDALAVMGRLAEREHINWRAEVVSPRD